MGSIVPFSRPQQPAAAPVPTRLTKRLVETIRPAARELFVWDASLAGFGLRVQPTGVRTYLVQYRDRANRTRRLALGRHGVITTEQARRMARQTLGAVAAGQNPSVERREARRRARTAAPPETVGQVVLAYLEYVAQRRKPSTVAGYRAVAKRLVIPRLGSTAARDLTPSAVRDWHTQLAATPTSGNRALALLSAALAFAGLENPCRKKLVERYREKKRDRFYTADELRRLGAALDEGERTRTIADGIIVAIRLLALTGCRAGEILHLRWDDVDLDAGVLRLPDAKAGSRLVPLSSAAMRYLAALPRRSRYVAPGRRPDEPVKLFTLEGNWRRIRKKVQLANARIHDLRHTVGTSAGVAGLNAFMVRDLLGHKTLAMTDRYVSQDVAPLRRAASIAVDPIAAALLGARSPAPVEELANAS